MADEKIETNEFDDLDADVAPGQEFSETPASEPSMVSAGDAGTEYDYNSAPEGVKAPPRVDLNGQTITINQAKIILPPASQKWDTTKGGDKKVKYCTFVLFYDHEGQQEFYSGVRVFQKDGDKYSHPTIMRDGANQASKLFQLYAKFKSKDPNEVSLKEFMCFLNSKPKVTIKTVEVTNPETQAVIKKNFVGNFVGESA